MLTTHYLEEADALAERIVVIDSGVVIADTSPQDAEGTRRQQKSQLQCRHAPGRRRARRAAGRERSVLRAARVRLLSNAPETVLRVLFERGVAIVDLEVTGADLEEAFLALTRREEER